MRFRYEGLTILLMLAVTLTGQDLNRAWQAYMATNSKMSELEAHRTVYTHEQITLRQEVDQLQNTSTWYNAWLNKYLLSNRSDRQLVILDSLAVIDAELEILRARQSREIQDLKLAYEDVLQTYEKEGVLTEEQRVASIQVAGLIRSIQPHPILFPDYGELLRIEWANPQQRGLLLQDIQALLRVKIAELDSLQSVREEEAELALRLAAFHQDLGLQMEADQDVQQRDASGDADNNLGWGGALAANEFYDNRTEDMTTGLSAETSEPVSINVPRENVGEMSLAQRSGQDLEYLKAKLDEYQALLATIDQELNHSP